ncbi:uncharacterized protein LTR77_008190 [Saxophila tyrrhenica]|uniref:Uncharacterized protein n=1 Tax=Saxophila tyrrhenica TaxID=1690608 RepID=A0AAV9P4W6_9PEZI|nr:hypothetical protein LTR77_008190 [Saxophila tyrrhenica]
MVVCPGYNNDSDDEEVLPADFVIKLEKSSPVAPMRPTYDPRVSHPEIIKQYSPTRPMRPNDELRMPNPSARMSVPHPKVSTSVPHPTTSTYAVPTNAQPAVAGKQPRDGKVLSPSLRLRRQRISPQMHCPGVQLTMSAHNGTTAGLHPRKTHKVAKPQPAAHSKQLPPTSIPHYYKAFADLADAGAAFGGASTQVKAVIDAAMDEKDREISDLKQRVAELQARNTKLEERDAENMRELAINQLQTDNLVKVVEANDKLKDMMRSIDWQQVHMLTDEVDAAVYAMVPP